jgi:hypothetical protein
VVGDVFEVMAQVDHRLTNVISDDLVIRVNDSDENLGRHNGEAPITHVPSTSTTTTTVQDGPSHTPTTINKIKWKLLLRGRSSPGERHQGAFKLIILPRESSTTS